MQPSNFDRLSYRLAMLSCGTVRMAANTPCAICGSSGVDMAVRNGGETFASRIANNAAEFDSPQKTGAFIAAGLVLFILTFIVNAIARIVIERRKAFTE